jgi:hypothetical protein
MYLIREDGSNILVEERNFGFGDRFALLMEPEEFLNRVKAAVDGREQKVEWNVVEDIDETSFEGTLGIFKKVSSFSYQSEFRVSVRGTGDALKLNLESLSDIVTLGGVSELNDRLTLHINALGQRELQIRNE